MASEGKLESDENFSWSLEPVVLSKGYENLPNLYLTLERAPLSGLLSRTWVKSCASLLMNESCFFSVNQGNSDNFSKF